MELIRPVLSPPFFPLGASVHRLARADKPASVNRRPWTLGLEKQAQTGIAY
jgi:hypothetical protein